TAAGRRFSARAGELAMKSLSIASTTVGTRGRVRVRESAWTHADQGFGTPVPRSFLVALDLLTLSLSFFAAYLVTPYARARVLHWLSSAWVATLAPGVSADLRPISEFGWVLFVMGAIVVLGMQLAGAYRPLIKQSRTQVVVSSVLAPL